jgi:acetyl/propionyl-CoA carboxylase alpha subunit
VGVYSAVDIHAPHVHIADEVYNLGDPEPLSSYLNIDKIITAAQETGADAIHPGYGFLAEHYIFAECCTKEGITFIGPSSKVIQRMGRKVEAKTTIKKAGVPVIPGYHKGDQDIQTLIEEGEALGFPLLIKAVAGGGGKGMRIVRKKEDLEKSIYACKREAEKSFGDGSIFLEKYVDRPRHIEFQVLGDDNGTMVHLYERECSIQRRHQKIIEETPSPVLTPELRKNMGEAAVKAAKAVDYTNAGTVEFMVDHDRNYYFLEMNTRLQVEHPITEYVTGIDLVKWQLRIAAGEELSLQQDKISQRGHAIECRIYAEDPLNEFLPCAGTIHSMCLPQGVNIRNDTGIAPGITVTSFYDPLLAKVTVYAETRTDALQKMAWALSKYSISGITTNINFLQNVITHQAFKRGDVTTHFIEEHPEVFSDPVVPQQLKEKAAAVAYVMAKNLEKEKKVESTTGSAWKLAFRPGRWSF